MKTPFPYRLAFWVLLLLLLPLSVEAQAQSPADAKQPKKAAGQKAPVQKKPVFVAPPRTVSDITAFLEQEKPDPAKRAALEATAATEPPAGASRTALKDFYWARARARAGLGRQLEAIADCEKAAANADDYVNDGSRIDQLRESLLRQRGDYRGALAVLEEVARKLDISNTNRGRTFSINLERVRILLFLAEVERAESTVKQSQALLAEARSWNSAQYYLSNWEAFVEEARGRVLSSRGRYSEAEAAYLRARTLYRDAQVKCPTWPIRTPCGYDGVIFSMTMSAASQKST
jgi:tetratricopeptide (TPR) repeat protein